MEDNKKLSDAQTAALRNAMSGEGSSCGTSCSSSNGGAGCAGCQGYDTGFKRPENKDEAFTPDSMLFNFINDSSNRDKLSEATSAGAAALFKSFLTRLIIWIAVLVAVIVAVVIIVKHVKNGDATAAMGTFAEIHNCIRSSAIL